MSEALRVPVGFETIKKTIRFCDVKTKKEKRKSDISKNELMLQMIGQAIANALIFKYIIADSWASKCGKYEVYQSEEEDIYL